MQRIFEPYVLFVKYIAVICLLCTTFVSSVLADSWENTSWDNTRYNTTEGTEFYAAFIKNAGETKDSENLALYLQAVASKTTKVKVTYLSDNSTEEFVVNGGTQVTKNINITKAYADYDNTPGKQPTEQITKCALYVTSDNPISLYVTNSLKNAYSGTCVLPTNALGRDYVVQTYLADKTSTEFAVVGTEEETLVTFNVQRTELDEEALSVDDGAFVDTVTYEEFTITLNRGEVFLYLSNKAEVGISGTRICADKPIAVFNGNQFARIPYFKDENQTHLSTQTYPIDRWGKQYVVTPTLKNDKEHVRLTAFENNTIIRKNGNILCTLNAFDTYQDTIYATANYYEATKPLACFLYTLTSGALTNHVAGRPSMTPITPLEYATKSLLFATFTSSKNNMLKNHYVNVVTHEDYVKTMLLDNSSIASHFKNDILVGSEKYKYAQIPISAVAHTLSNSNSKGVFVARIYGMGTNDKGTVGESYAYAAGSRVSRKIDILVDGQYIKEKTICKGAPAIKFDGLIGFGLDGNDEVSWCIKEIGNAECDTIINEKIDGSYSISHYFQTDSIDKDFEVSLIVTQNAPSICDGCYYTNTVSDTVKVYIHLKTTYGFKNINNYCYGTEFTLHKDSIIYNIVADTVNTYTPLFDKPFKINRQYNITDRLYSKDGCDSIIQQIFYIRVPDTVTVDTAICDNQQPFVWHLDPFTGKKDSIIIDTIRGEKLTVTRSQPYDNRYGCESLAKLNLHICPVFIDTTILDTCQQPIGRTYRWMGHENHYVYDVHNKRKIKADKIPIYIPGEFTYIDSLKTEPCDDCPSAGCDSIWVLDLTVSHVYSYTQDTTMSNEDYIEWQGLKIGGEDVSISNLDYVVTKDTTLIKEYTTEHDCDSIYTLCIHYGKLFRDTTNAAICENELEYIWFWNGRALDTITPLPTQDTTYIHTTKSSIGVDSIFYLNLSILPISTYSYSVTWCRSAGPYSYPSTPEYPLPNLQGLLESDVYRDTLYGANQYGCDSIIELHLEVLDTIVVPIYHSLCDNELPYNHPDKSADNLQNLTVSGVYRDTLISKLTNCDSVVVLHLQVNYQTQYDTTIYICENHLPYVDSHTNIKYTHSTSYNDTILNIAGCDSIIHVDLIVTDTFHTYLDTTLCSSSAPYYHPDRRAHHLQGLLESGVYYDTISSYQYGCDSILILDLTIHPISTYTHSVTWCRSAGPYNYPSTPEYPLHNLQGLLESDVYRDTLYGANQYGCDSIIELHLEVLDTIVVPIYHSLCDNELPYNHPDKSADNLQNLTVSGVYRDTLISKLTGCDSIVVLHLQVNSTYITPIEVSICDNELPYTWMANDAYGIYTKEFGIDSTDTFPIVKYDSMLLKSIYGCDSLVVLTLSIYPTYEFLQQDSICQDPTNKYWVWIDQFGGKHDSIDISESGLITIADTLKTVHGCDSLFGIQLYVKPSYRFDSIYTICQNERIDWQGRGYSGDNYGWHYERKETNSFGLHVDSIYYNYEIGDTILSHGVHYDTVRYTTSLGCDSIYYLKLVIMPTNNSIIEASACDNDSFYVFTTNDIYDSYNDTIFIQPITRWVDSLHKDTAFYMYERTLQTKSGCDSVVHLHLTTYPSYQYTDYARICQNTKFEWHGNKYSSSGVYYDSCLTEYGCDSVHILNLYVKPVLEIHIDTNICDNQLLMHSDTLWYGKDSTRFDTINTVLWKPGMEIPKPNESRYIRYQSYDGECDSIIYKYSIHVNPTFRTDTFVTLCSNEVLLLNEFSISLDTMYSVDYSISAIDTILMDTLQTIHGCDSVLVCHAHILPAYKYIDYDTICESDTCFWRDTMFVDMLPGDHSLVDNMTSIYGCDSIYELRLHVNPIYEFEYDTTICSNELFIFYGDTLTETGTYHANHPSIYACDSVTTLHLTVHDTTFNLLYDTICISEKYRFRDSIITQTGYYAFVSTNEWGCMQYDSICLTVIDTTTYTLYIGDILCADEEELMVEYEVVSGPELIEYSVLFDQFGHSQGFEDIYHAPLDTKGRYLSIPLPKGEVLPHPTPTYFDSQQGVNQYTYDDKYAYPLPANYHITVIMHNAICGDTLQRKDTTFNLLYPSWIHEQHWNDGIVLYNDMYNGGHKFSAYQWYQNGDTIYGATKEYLHIPSDLLMNDRGNCENYYQVELTRESDGYKTMTCPICPVLLGDTIVPTKDYFSVVPTIVDHRNPIVHILSTKPGKYSYVPYNLLGQGVGEHKQGTFVPNGNNYAGIIDLSGLGTGTILINVIVDDQPRAFYITIN